MPDQDEQAEQKPKQRRTRSYTIFHYDGHRYERVATLNARNRDEAEDTYIEKAKEQIANGTLAIGALMTIPTKYATLRRPEVEQPPPTVSYVGTNEDEIKKLLGQQKVSEAPSP